MSRTPAPEHPVKTHVLATSQRPPGQVLSPLRLPHAANLLHGDWRGLPHRHIRSGSTFWPEVFPPAFLAVWPWADGAPSLSCLSWSVDLLLMEGATPPGL